MLDTSSCIAVIKLSKSAISLGLILLMLLRIFSFLETASSTKVLEEGVGLEEGAVGAEVAVLLSTELGTGGVTLGVEEVVDVGGEEG